MSGFHASTDCADVGNQYEVPVVPEDIRSFDALGLILEWRCVTDKTTDSTGCSSDLTFMPAHIESYRFFCD